jgi:hypothetical protein
MLVKHDGRGCLGENGLALTQACAVAAFLPSGALRWRRGPARILGLLGEGRSKRRNDLAADRERRLRERGVISNRPDADGKPAPTRRHRP